MADDGNTKLKASLLRAKAGGAPSMGQWLQYPGHHLASTVASLGPDVSAQAVHPHPRIPHAVSASGGKFPCDTRLEGLS